MCRFVNFHSSRSYIVLVMFLVHNCCTYHVAMRTMIYSILVKVYSTQEVMLSIMNVNLHAPKYICTCADVHSVVGGTYMWLYVYVHV